MVFNAKLIFLILRKFKRTYYWPIWLHLYMSTPHAYDLILMLLSLRTPLDWTLFASKIIRFYKKITLKNKKEIALRRTVYVKNEIGPIPFCSFSILSALITFCLSSSFVVIRQLNLDKKKKPKAKHVTKLQLFIHKYILYYHFKYFCLFN